MTVRYHKVTVTLPAADVSDVLIDRARQVSRLCDWRDWDWRITSMSPLPDVTITFESMQSPRKMVARDIEQPTEETK